MQYLSTSALFACTWDSSGAALACCGRGAAIAALTPANMNTVHLENGYTLNSFVIFGLIRTLQDRKLWVKRRMASIASPESEGTRAQGVAVRFLPSGLPI